MVELSHEYWFFLGGVPPLSTLIEFWVGMLYTTHPGLYLSHYQLEWLESFHITHGLEDDEFQGFYHFGYFEAMISLDDSTL